MFERSTSSHLHPPPDIINTIAHSPSILLKNYFGGIMFRSIENREAEYWVNYQNSQNTSKLIQRLPTSSKWLHWAINSVISMSIARPCVNNLRLSPISAHLIFYPAIQNTFIRSPTDGVLCVNTFRPPYLSGWQTYSLIYYALNVIYTLVSSPPNKACEIPMIWAVYVDSQVQW